MLKTLLALPIFLPLIMLQNAASGLPVLLFLPFALPVLLIYALR